MTHDAHWIRRGFEAGQKVELEDVSAERAVIGVMGPRSRELLTAVSGADLSNGAFPFMTWQNIEIEGVEIRAMRLTFVGELGWELHIPSDQALAVYDRLAFFALEDPEVVLLGRETIYRDGVRAGWLNSGGFGYSIHKPIGFGYVSNEGGVDREFLLGGNYELEVAGNLVPCSIHLEPLYDPKMEKVRA